ncbi:MAG: Ti-type conjugative transfer relaxase TraA [Frankiales bacterium]|nr:Ti-type conjugative transfer relaxase TraA [Frankiales bacterium]
MMSICMLGGAGTPSGGVGRYYLMPDQVCGLAYYTEHDQLPGRWLGDGAQALGLTGPLGTAGAVRLEQLLKAQDPDGQALARPVLRADPAGRLPAGPLLTSLRDVARSRGVPLDELLISPSNRAALLGLVRRTGISEGIVPSANGALATGSSTLATASGVLPTGPGMTAKPVTVDAAVAGRLASAAGLDPVELYRAADGTDRYAAAAAKAGGRVDIRRAGIDVTVSAPKSVSVLAALADPETAALIELCHDRAVQQALGYLQRHAGHGLRGHHGDGQVMDRVATDGWIAVGFTHYTSRAGDPQLHTHLVLPNLLHGADGKWSAIDSRAVHRHLKTAGYLYHAALRYEISQQFSITWHPPAKGMSEIREVPKAVLREFSTRRRQIERALATTGGKGLVAAQAACLATRQRKTHISLTILREAWAQRSTRLGASPAELLKALTPRQRSWARRQPAGPALEDLTSAHIMAIAEQVLGSGGVTLQQTSFDRRALVQAIAVTVPVEYGGDAQRLEDLADSLLVRPGVVPLVEDEQGGRRWTTLELLTTEYRALDLAAARNGRPTDLELLKEVLAVQPGLSRDQAHAIRVLADDDRFVRVLVGPAGSGKTAVVTAARDLAQRDGQPVVGCALAALTAQRLQQGSAVPSSSLASLLSRLDNGQALEPRTLVIVDEAGMVGTRDLARLFEHVQQAHGRVLLVGDPEQLPEIDAGGLFRHLSQPEALPAQLVGNQRQRNAWEAGALELLRANRPVIALGEYARHDRVTASSTKDEMHEQVAADYLDALRDCRSPRQIRQTVVLAAHRADVDLLNQSIRTRIQQAGRLGPDVHQTVDDRTYAVGDEVIVAQQCRDRSGGKVLNGTRGTVTRGTAMGLGFQPDRGPEIILDAPTIAASVQHGYALTIHKAQGLTATTALIVGDGLTRQSAYTALSRGRERNQLYLHDDPGAPDDGPSPFQRLCEQLTRGGGDTLASQQLPRQTRSRTRTRSDGRPPVAVEQRGLSR